jgi:guanylate kinase
METMASEGQFIETAEFSENMYGTSKAAVEKVAENG